MANKVFINENYLDKYINKNVRQNLCCVGSLLQYRFVMTIAATVRK